MKWRIRPQAGNDARKFLASADKGPHHRAGPAAPAPSAGPISEALLGHALDAVSEGALVTDADQRIVYANAAFTVVTGYSAQETVGKNCRFLQGPGTDPRTVAALRMALASHETFRGEILNYRKDGTAFWNALTVSPVKGANGVVTHFVSVQRDITAQRALQARLQSMAVHDPVTGLPNRPALDRHLSGLKQRYEGRECYVAVGVIDVDDFKSVNDLYGHDAGDFLLAELADRIRVGLRETDFAARLGGDEFAIVIEDLDPEMAGEQLENILSSLCRVIGTEFVLPPSSRMNISISLGLALFVPVVESGDAVLRRAGSALVDLKRRKGNRSRWWQLDTAAPEPLVPERFTDSLWAERVPSGPRTVTASDSALSRRERLFNGGLRMYFQPVVNLLDGGLHLLEALARLQLEDSTILPPGSFLPQLDQEDTDRLFLSSLDQTLAQLDVWNSAGLQLRASINVHPATLVNPQCPQWVASALNRHNISPHRLVLEVLEDGIEKSHAHNHSFSELRALGVGMAQDDLGAGHSSLRRLTALAFDTVKIDHRVTGQLYSSPIPMLTFLATMATMSENMGWQIVAEGLEDEGITEAVTMLGIPYGQGYHLARPMPAAQIPAWINAWQGRSHRSGIQSPLGALAFHWRYVRRASPHPGVTESCPLTPFLAAVHAASHVRAWHQSQHADSPNSALDAGKLLEWLTRAATESRAPAPPDPAA